METKLISSNTSTISTTSESELFKREDHNTVLKFGDLLSSSNALHSFIIFNSKEIIKIYKHD